MRDTTPNLTLRPASFSKNAIKFFPCYSPNTNMATGPLPHVQRELCAFIRVTSCIAHCLYICNYMHASICKYGHYLQLTSTVSNRFCSHLPPPLEKSTNLHCLIPSMDPHGHVNQWHGVGCFRPARCLNQF